MNRRKRKLNVKRIFILIAVVLAISFTVFVYISYFSDKEDSNEKPTNTSSEHEEINKILNPLTGESGFDEDKLDIRPVAVVISNAPGARPQWGITTPDMIVEGVTEGGITRLLAIYSDMDDIPEKLGPIRSARHDFIEIAQGLDAIYVHWGGSTYAYSHIKNQGITTIDAISNSQYFKRDKSRNLEHSGYTAGGLIIKAISNKNIRTNINSSYKSLYRFNDEDDPKTLAGGDCNSLRISFSQSFNYTFNYNSDTKTYYSSLNSNKFRDNNGNQLSFTNLIILYCGTSLMNPNDKKDLRIDMDLSSGSGVYVSMGSYKNITWKKGNASDSLQFYDQDGNALALNAGKSYIGLVPKNRQSNTSIS